MSKAFAAVLALFRDDPGKVSISCMDELGVLIDMLRLGLAYLTYRKVRKDSQPKRQPRKRKGQK